MIDRYFSRIHRYLGTYDLTASKTAFGYAFIKGNCTLPKGAGVLIDGLKLELKDRVFHERVLWIQRPIGLRSHQEEDREIVMNIGFNPVRYLFLPEHPGPVQSECIRPRETMYSVNGEGGFVHGFDVEYGKEGLLYVAKALFPEFAEGNSFRMPENTYSESDKA